MSAARAVALQAQKRIALVWFDAHTDRYFSSRGRNIPHAIALNQLLGEGTPVFREVTGQNNFFRPADVLLIGPRDQFSRTPEAQQKLRDDGFYLLTPEDIRSRPMSVSISEILERLKEYDEIHLSFDVDVVSEAHIRGFGHKLAGGPSITDVFQLTRALANTGKITSMDFVELNPILDFGGHTIQFAREFILRTLKEMRLAPKN